MLLDVDSIQDFSAANLLKLTEYAIAKILAGGQVRGHNGRMLTEASLGELRDFRDSLKREVTSEDPASAGGTALVEFGNPRG